MEGPIHMTTEKARTLSRLLGGNGAGGGVGAFQSRDKNPLGCWWLFPVNIVKDGGADATDGFTRATWTYTIKDLLNGETMATSNAPKKPREYGLAEYQTAGTAVGMAFYDKDGVIQLWDAGEVIKTADPCVGL